MTIIIVLFIVATALVLAEVMFPSFGILGISAATLYLFAILRAFDIGETEGYSAIALTVVLIPSAIAGGFALLKHTAIGNVMLMSVPDHEELSGAAAPVNLKVLKGKIGVTMTPLRPSGMVEVDGNRIDAVSDGEYIGNGVAVKLVHIEGTRVLVEPLNSSDSDTNPPKRG